MIAVTVSLIVNFPTLIDIKVLGFFDCIKEKLSCSSEFISNRKETLFSPYLS
jgi:hypothetical protein